MNGIATVFVILLVIAFVIFSPFLMIWALNTLFPVLAIGYSIKTWFAIVIIAGLFRGNITYNKKS